MKPCARPGDVGLRGLFERLRPGADTERGEVARSGRRASGPRTKPLLLLQAAFEFERAGEARRCSARLESRGRGRRRPAREHHVRADRARYPEAARVSEELLRRAREASDPVEQRELYEQLGEFDRARGDASSAILWMGALLERSPEHLPALRRLEQAFITNSRDEDLEPVAAELARLLEDREAKRTRASRRGCAVAPAPGS